MAQIENKETVNIGGKNYIIEDLSEKSKYFLAQLQDLYSQKQASQARLHQIDMAVYGFEQELQKSIEEPKEEGA